MVVTCFRVGAVVQAGGESKGIRRRDWPVVSCRAEPPLARCDGSQTLGISRPKVSKGDRSGWDRRGAEPDGDETAGTRGTVARRATPGLGGASGWARVCGPAPR
jgi:hypothetical protein